MMSHFPVHQGPSSYFLTQGPHTVLRTAPSKCLTLLYYLSSPPTHCFNFQFRTHVCSNVGPHNCDYTVPSPLPLTVSEAPGQCPYASQLLLPLAAPLLPGPFLFCNPGLKGCPHGYLPVPCSASLHTNLTT